MLSKNTQKGRKGVSHESIEVINHKNQTFEIAHLNSKDCKQGTRSTSIFITIFRGSSKRMSMSNTKLGDQYKISMEEPKAGDDKHTFAQIGKRINCNAGNRLSDGRHYVIKYDSSGKVGCGPFHDLPEEEWDLFSTKVSAAIPD